MKRMYDYVYSRGQLSPTTVWYTVAVGISRADQAAKAFIDGMARNNCDMLFVLHDKAMSDFKDKVAESLFASPVDTKVQPMRLLRQKVVPVTQLAKFLRNYPAEFLNSEAITDTQGFLSFLPRSGKYVLPSPHE